MAYNSISPSVLCPECSPSALLHNLNAIGVNTPNHVWIIAYSGGVDSAVLVDLIASARAQIHAHIRVAHINHNMQSEAQGWQTHCQTRCEQLSLPFLTRTVEVVPTPQTSLEALAREARYTALIDITRECVDEMGWGHTGVVLTAHHQADQAETLLLQLLRGAGGKGLSGMPVMKPLGANCSLARPLLSCSKDTLLAYAQHNELHWIEDPSNQSTEFDRNYLRHAILPLMRERFPHADTTLSRSAQLLAQQHVVLAELIESTGLACSGTELDTSSFERMSRALQSEVVRHWLSQNQVVLPSQAIVHQLLGLLHSAPDKQGGVTWGASDVRACVRFYDRALWLVHDLPDVIPEKVIEFDVQEGVSWSIGEISVTITPTMLNQLGLTSGRCELIFNPPRQTKVYLLGRKHSTSLKNAFQSMKVPPWLRLHCPLIRVDGIVKHIINIRDCLNPTADVVSKR